VVRGRGELKTDRPDASGRFVLRGLPAAESASGSARREVDVPAESAVVDGVEPTLP
jgi:hypothetical protein